MNLVDAPEQWRKQALEKGYVILGDVSVRVFASKDQIPEGYDPVRV
jgi:hypothetical protein